MKGTDIVNICQLLETFGESEWFMDIVLLPMGTSTGAPLILRLC